MANVRGSAFLKSFESEFERVVGGWAAGDLIPPTSTAAACLRLVGSPIISRRGERLER
jgi:hypothetical protein